MEDDQQFCLRWNNHQSTLISVFDTLLEKGIHVDCTLAAEGQTLRAHKVVLSACSPYFESVLSQQYDKHPIIILKDVKYAELRAMMDYMYRGEVNISQDQLAALLKAAESLQIKGLSDNKPAKPPNTHPPRSTTPVTKMRDGSADSRESSTSPTRRRKKARRASTDGLTPTTNSLPVTLASTPVAVPVPVPVPAAPAPPADEAAGGEPADCKVEEGSRGTDGEGVEDLTLDEENEEPPAIAQNDVVRNFQWHMERSQEEMMNTDGARDSQEIRKDSSHISSALLSLLSAQHAQSQALVPPCIQVTNLLNPTLTKELTAYPPGFNLSKMSMNALEGYQGSILEKTHLLQQALLQNNNTLTQNSTTDYIMSHTAKNDETESDIEYDDTDDILLPEEVDTMYGSNESLSPGSRDGSVQSPTDIDNPFVKHEHMALEDASRQFECRHCGKRYRWKSTLRRHENVECGGKAPSHQCPYCNYKAKQRGNLGVHIRKHHNKEWYIYASNKIRKNKKTPV